MPNGFYELPGYLAFVGFVVPAYQAHQNNNNTAAIIYAALALIFQPFLKIVLVRDLRNIIDVVIGIGLLVPLFISREEIIGKK